MRYENLFDELINARDEERAAQMSAYMKNQFAFMGLPSPARKVIFSKYLKIMKQTKDIDMDFVFKCWESQYREMQYIAIDYLQIKRKYLTYDDIPDLKKLITTKSWWDSVDGFCRIFETLSQKYESIADLMIEWSEEDNMWLRRTAIIYQLHLKEKTNIKILEKIICNNFGSNEFFINKAIGWSLREYSKTNPEWVRGFIEKYRESLSNLSIKEGTKYI